MKNIYNFLFSKFLFLFLFLGYGFMSVSNAQNINVEFQFNSATILSSSGTGSNCGDNDCGGFNQPDPRMNLYFGYNGGNLGPQYRMDRDGIACNSYQTCTTCPGNTNFTNIGFTSTIYLNMDANEDDNFASGSADGSCGGLGTPSAGTGSGGAINAIAPCAFSGEQTSNRTACSSDGVTEDWGWRWQWRWSWNAGSLTDANAGGTISFSVAGNTTICAGAGSPVSQLNGTTLLSNYFSARQWQMNYNGGGFAAAAGTNNGQNYTPPANTFTNPGTYQYRRALTYCTNFSGGTTTVYSNYICVVAFPAAPTMTALANTCNSELADITAVAAVTGFTAEYAVQAPGGALSAYGTLAAANALTVNTPGCWTISARYRLTSACSGVAAGTIGPSAACQQSTINAVVFPPAPTITPLANSCNAQLADITAVPLIAGFTAEYAVQAPGGALSAYGTLAAANALTTFVPGCWTIKARYRLTAACGGTGANTVSSDVACQESTIYALVFPNAPNITAIANTCNTKLADITAVTAISGLTAEYAVQAPGAMMSGYSDLATANGLLTNTPGCWTIKARYKLTDICGTIPANTTSTILACQERTIYAVVFPPAPSLTAISNTCGTKLADITAIPDLTANGFTAEYAVQKPGTALSAYGTLAAANAILDATPGCWTIKARYKLTSDCGSPPQTAANAISANVACQETTINAVVFPSAPTLTPLSNTCNADLAAITAVAPVSGFTAEYAVQAPGGALSAYGTLAAANTLTTNTPGCWTIKARYKLTAACGLTGANATSGDVACQETTINAVVFPPAPSITALSNTCDAKLADITAVTPLTDFTAEYAVQAPGGSLSAYGDLASTNGLLTNTPGCWTIKARYKLTAACGGTAANATSGTLACQESTIYGVVFPPAPVITAPTTTCVGTPFVLPTVSAVTGFTVQYSINGGAYTATPTVPTTAGTHTVRARYVLTSACGSTAANSAGSGLCLESNQVDAVISPLPVATPTTQLYTCDNTAVLLATGISGGTTVSWQYVSGPVLPTGTSTSNPLLVNFSSPGTGSYNLLGSNTGCTNINLGNVNVVLPSISSTTIASSASCAYCVINDGNVRTFYNSSGHLIAKIEDDALVTPSELDTTEVCVRLDGSVQYVTDNYGNLQPYLQRQWTIKPVNNTNSIVTLYFTNAELTALQAAANSSVYQFSGYSSLSLTKYPGGQNGTFTGPATLNGVGMNGNFSSYGSDHKVEFMVNSFSTFYIHPVLFPFAALPVELTSFTGWNQGTVNRLQWVTASELNTSKFIIEKSISQGIWTVIGEKTAAGNSSQSLTYDFTDNNPVEGNNYYRLKVVDLDGTFSYSNIINIPLGEVVVNNFTRVYPNPTGGLLNVEIQSTETYDTKVIVYDVVGKKVLDRASNLNKGLNTLQFDFSQLSNGSYILQFADRDGKVHSIKFIKD